MSRRIVVVKSSGRAEIDRRIWSALETLLPVRFVFGSPSQSPDAVIVPSNDDRAHLHGSAPEGSHDGQLHDAHTSVRADCKCFVVADGRENTESTSGDVVFGRDAGLDARLRGRRLRHKPLQGVGTLQVDAGDRVLASFGEAPCWIVRRRSAGDVHCVSVGLPQLEAGELPFHHLNGDAFLQMLPLLHFLREVVDERAWQPPPARACLMIDDPNLHWPSYGYLRYREIAELAERERFHVASATVPLDSWYVHPRTATIFREHRNQVSLLIHGNDHLSEEFGTIRPERQTVEVLAQALRRIHSLERRAGVRVSRVIAPPHEAFRPDLSPIMFRLGFEGVCISPWSLQDWAGGHQYGPAFGLQPAELVDDEFPLIPRFGLSTDCEGWVVINAFLNRPLVAATHHDGLKDGVGAISTVARFINALPEVEWADMTTIARSSFYTRTEDSTLLIRPFASRISVRIPEGVTSVAFQSDADGFDASWRSCVETATPMGDGICAVVPGSIVSFQRRMWGTLDTRSVRAPRSVWAPVRRLLCEARDRVRPVFNV